MLLRKSRRQIRKTDKQADQIRNLQFISLFISGLQEFKTNSCYLF